MPETEKAEVIRAIKAVQSAYDDLQALRTSRHALVPLSLLVASTALDKLSRNLDLLASSAEALAVFNVFSVAEPGVSIRTSLSNALVHDMETIAKHLRSMIPQDPAGTPDDLDDQKCRDVADMVDRYDRTIFSVLTRYNVCV
jgi:hypothetical protein